MKTEISRDSHQPQKRYSGVYQQQGRMLTDADWNELVEILKERLNDALKDVVGNKAGSMGGTPRHRALKIVKDVVATFKIQPGHVYIDGVTAQVSGDKDIAYGKQPDFLSPPGLPKTSGLADKYIIYADVWERTVTHLMDERLRDKGLHGSDTCTRKQMMAQVKWCPKTVDPEISDKNPSKGDAELSLKLHQKTIEPDPCDPCAAQLDVESKTGNYLFRVEVHDVKGDADSPTEITLKWSSENGAEQFEALPKKEDMPAGFISDKWAYEFFDETSEQHLGVHLEDLDDWQPVRHDLSSEYNKPKDEPNRFVRRWDGYCTLNLSSRTPFTGGMDRGIVLSTRKDSNAPGYVKIDSSSLHIKLSSINLDMVLDAKKFVAGDYWLADVREAEHDPLDTKKSKLIENELPHGIEHHYLTLGTVVGSMVGGTLRPNPEADRKYAFPPLTEMTRMFMAGGDGQEAMPEHVLLYPIKVGVANGEWPVTGAKVRFSLLSGDGQLSLTDSPFSGAAIPIEIVSSNGLAQCFWRLGDGISTKRQRVKAELLGPDGSTPLDHPPVYFNANLSTAENVAFTPDCPGVVEPTIHSLLGDDIGVTWPVLHDGHDHSTVKDVLDTLLCKLRASHIPFYPDECTEGEPTVKTQLGVDTAMSIHAILQKLICELDAADIPFDPEDCDSGVLQPTVKTGLDVTARTTIHEVLQKLLCELDAGIIPYNPNASPVTNSRWRDIKEEQSGTGDLTEPDTVQKAIDDLIKWLESSDIIYEFQDSCADTAYGVKSLNSYVREDLGKTAPNSTTKIKDLWDKLLCLLDANRIPYDPTLKEARWRDIKELSHLGMMWSVQEETPGVPKCSRLVRDLDGNVIATASSNEPKLDKLSKSMSAKFYSQILKLDDQGHILWRKFIDVFIGGLGIQQDGTIVIAGSFSDEVNLGESSGVLTPEGECDLFVAKLNSNGDVFWKDQYGSTESEILTGLAIDSNDAIYLTGHFKETINFGGSDLVPGADKDIFIVKINSDGSHEWSYRYATSGEVEDAQISVDRNDNILVTGDFRGSLDFGGGSLESSSPTTQSVFFAKLNSDGVHQWSYKYGGTKDCKGCAIALDNDNNILLCGSYKDTINFGGEDLPTVDEYDAYVAKFTLDKCAAYVAKFTDNGSDISELWSKAFVGTFISAAFCIAADADNNIVFGGSFIGSINFGGGEITSEDIDGFLTRIDADGNFIWANRFSVRNYIDYPFAIVLDNDGYPTFAWQLWQFNRNMTLNKVSKLNWEMRIAPATVQEALDDLIENLESSDINYRLPVCAGTKDSVRKRLHSISWVPDNTALKIKDLFDALLCELDASSIPYDRNTNIGSLLDGFVNKSGGDTITGDLSVNGTVTATAFEGDGISAGKWSDGTGGAIYYNGGNVGIGTTVPSHKLDVRGATGPYLAYFKNDNNGTGTTYGLYAEGDARDTASSQGRGAIFYGRGSLSGAPAFGSLNYAFAYGKSDAYAVYANGTGGTTTGRKYAFYGLGDSYFSGNVGIGTTNPSSELHIAGAQPVLKLDTNTTFQSVIAFLANGARKWEIFTDSGGSSKNNLSFRDTAANATRLFIDHTGNVGIGTTSPTHKLEVHGNFWVRNWTTVGSDYAEYFESQNGKAIPAGTAVVLENGKARRAKKNETPMGIVSANPGMAGGVHVEWPKKYLRDEFGSLIMEEYQDEIMAPKREKVKKERQKVEKKTIEEEVTRTEIVFEKKKYRQKETTETVTREIEEPVFEEVDLYDAEGKNVIGRHKIPVMETYEEEIEVLDEDGQPVLAGTGEFVTKKRPKINPDYDESREYVPREKRPEWNCVGLLGQLFLRKGQPVAPTWVKIKDISDEVELWLAK